VGGLTGGLGELAGRDCRNGFRKVFFWWWMGGILKVFFFFLLHLTARCFDRVMGYSVTSLLMCSAYICTYLYSSTLIICQLFLFCFFFLFGSLAMISCLFVLSESTLSPAF